MEEPARDEAGLGGPAPAAPAEPPPEAGEPPREPPHGEPPPADAADDADPLARAWARWDRRAYAAFAAACVIYAAWRFYGSLHLQTRGDWSAPLDDVFIHFDYARATARGYPFQWSEGNGFSSGNTSLTYPFVLAIGYLAGFRGVADGSSLMVWAAIVGCVSTFAFLLASARLFAPLGRWAKYLGPPAVLSLGALDWSLFSGMENAFHLAVWGLVLVAATFLFDAPDARARRRRGGRRGGGGALLFATRPESVACLCAFGVLAAIRAGKADGRRAGLATLLRAGLPGAAVLVAQALANRALTGEWSANGAIAKLALNNPYMTPAEKWAEYLFHLKYVVVRNTEHHFADVSPYGWIVPALAAIPLFDRRTRTSAALLWAQIAGWSLLVAMNGQVRWQNERYTMAAVAWLLLLAAMGLGVLARGALAPDATRGARVLAFGRLAVAAAAAALYLEHQAPNMRDQLWFFGRASRNIRDQHLVAGTFLGRRDVAARRVLVGDAGALMYASDRPGLDLIGLGGYHDLPFARAAVHGLGASLELIERMPGEDRPDYMAIYPSWWGDLPTLFGQRLVEFPVTGNVICGGSEKVVYRADWRALDRKGDPRTLEPGERVVDQVDVADLVSEGAHAYVFPHPSMGFVELRVLADPADRTRDLFDAGRIIPAGQRETARVRAPREGGRLIARSPGVRSASVEVRADGVLLGRLELRKGSAWAEASVAIPPGLPPTFELTLTPVDAEWADHHVWIVEGGGASQVAAGAAP